MKYCIKKTEPVLASEIFPGNPDRAGRIPRFFVCVVSDTKDIYPFILFSNYDKARQDFKGRRLNSANYLMDVSKAWMVRFPKIKELLKFK